MTRRPTSSSEQDGRARRRQRAPKVQQIERTVQTVLDATLELLSEVGYRNLTIQLIAERSGVARSTIYRHWNNVPDIALTAFDNALGPTPFQPDSGSIREDLRRLYQQLSKALKRSVWGRSLPSLIEATFNDPDFKGLLPKLTERRRAPTRQLFYRAIERGELRPDIPIDWVLDAITGTLYQRLLITGAKLDTPGLIDWAIDSALDSFKAR